MKTITYTIKNNDEKIEINGHWNAADADFECSIYPIGGDNADAGFILKIDGGQVFEGNLNMAGSWEREGFKEMLKLILKYL